MTLSDEIERLAAKFHSYRELPDNPGETTALFQEMARSQYEGGARFFRYTVISPEHPKPPYPDGLWVEGWEQRNVRALPFGAAGPDGAISPPLTAASLRASTEEKGHG